jgi:hypothetical protein
MVGKQFVLLSGGIYAHHIIPSKPAIWVLNLYAQ